MENRFQDNWKLEGGIDEAGRGCLAGRVYTACVILPEEFPDEKYLLIKDSKKLSAKKRSELREYIETHAIAYAVEYAEADEVDEVNILQATIRCMHRAIQKMKVVPEYLVIDGTYFKPFVKEDKSIIPFSTIKGADNKYRHVAAASILAKTHHDEYVVQLLTHHPDYEKYGWRDNMCYGTAKHIQAIKEHGITPFHRKSFSTCQPGGTDTSKPKYNKYKTNTCLIDSDSEDEPKPAKRKKN